MASTAPTNDKSPVLKALRLLAHVAASSEPPTLAELSRAMQLPKPTTYRLARALESAGFVRKDPLTLRYQIGATFENVALSGLRNSAAHGARRLLMNQLAEQLGARVNLVVLKAGNLAFVQWVEFDGAAACGDPRRPADAGALQRQRQAVAGVRPRRAAGRRVPLRTVPGYTKNTITTARGLAKELDAIRKRGYSVDDQELLSGVNCLAVPVHNRARQIVAGLAVMAPVASLPLEKLKRHVPDIKACAAGISAELGFEPLTPSGQRLRCPHPPRRPQRSSERKCHPQPTIGKVTYGSDAQRCPKHPEDHRCGRASG